jgi:D-amino peptidase
VKILDKKTQNFKILIVNDIEGISGVDNVRQIQYGYREFEDGRIQVTEDVNAAVRGLRAAGAQEILVADSHGSGGPNKNIIPERLERNVKLFQEGPVYKRLKEAADKSVDAAVFVGFHAMADTKDGFLRHTITLDPRIRMNGKPVGETAIDAYALAEYGIPVIMATGDQALTREASTILPGIETVQVKTSLDCKTTNCLPLPEARRLIETAAKRALSRIDEFLPLRIAKPIETDVSFSRKEQTDLCENIPRAKRKGENTISYIAEDWNEAYSFVRTTISLVGQYVIAALEKKLSKLEGFDRAVQEWQEDLISEWLP